MVAQSQCQWSSEKVLAGWAGAGLSDWRNPHSGSPGPSERFCLPWLGLTSFWRRRRRRDAEPGSWGPWEAADTEHHQSPHHWRPQLRAPSTSRSNWKLFISIFLFLSDIPQGLTSCNLLVFLTKFFHWLLSCESECEDWGIWVRPVLDSQTWRPPWFSHSCSLTSSSAPAWPPHWAETPCCSYSQCVQSER